MAVLRRTRMSPSSDHPASDVVWDHARADLINHLPKKTHIRQVYYAAIDIFKEVNKLPEECKMLIIIPIINQTFDCKNQIFVPTVAFFIFLYATKLYFQNVLYDCFLYSISDSDITPNGTLRRRRSRIPCEDDDGNLMDFLRTSGQDNARERKSWGSLGT